MRFWVAAVALIAVLIAAIVYLRLHTAAPSSRSAARQSAVGCRIVGHDFRYHRSGLWVTLRARVTRLLPDSQGRYRHQRFIVRCRNGQSILIVNDVSIGARVPVRKGDTVGVRGEYVWNERGGLVHFTHHSDTGAPGGWILWHSHVYALVLPRWTTLGTKTWIRDACRGMEDAQELADRLLTSSVGRGETVPRGRPVQST